MGDGEQRDGRGEEVRLGSRSYGIACPEAMTPSVKVCCVVCGGTDFVVVCPADEIQAHQYYLSLFHRRRLRSDAPQAALEDRADFTQDDTTHIVACTRCGLLLRNPRPRLRYPMLFGKSGLSRL